MTKKEINLLYKEFKVPKHIIKHMEKVALFAAKFVDRLGRAGQKIDKKLVVTAALIHDTLRVCDFKNISASSFSYKVDHQEINFWLKLRKKYGKYGHEKAMAKVLMERDEKALANLVAKHGFHSIDKLKTIEEKTLYYADKRVDNDKIVSLKERLILGKKRNTKLMTDLDKIKKIDKKIVRLEKEFESLLGERIN